MQVLSVVCARGGSKGLKNKCVTKIRDKMVIEFSIEYSLSLGKHVKTVISTDIDEVINYCERNRVDYIRRDTAFCRDDTKIEAVLADAIEKKGADCNYCSLVYGNIPTRYPKIFHEAVEFLEVHGDYDAVISMQNVGKFHPKWIFDYDSKLLPKVKQVLYRRQDLPAKMIHDGHTLIFKSEGFLKRWRNSALYDNQVIYSIFGSRIKPLINNRLILDIDEEKDLKAAKAIIEQ